MLRFSDLRIYKMEKARKNERLNIFDFAIRKKLIWALQYQDVACEQFSRRNARHGYRKQRSLDVLLVLYNLQKLNIPFNFSFLIIYYLLLSPSHNQRVITTFIFRTSVPTLCGGGGYTTEEINSG